MVSITYDPILGFTVIYGLPESSERTRTVVTRQQATSRAGPAPDHPPVAIRWPHGWRAGIR